MAIIFNEKTKEFHLFNDYLSYVICILPNGHIGNLYYGKRVSEKSSYTYLLEKRQRPLTAYVYEDDETFSLQHTRQDYACYGTGDFSQPAFEIISKDGSRLSDFIFDSYRIFDGKLSLKGLPHVYVEKENEAQTLEILLKDTVSKTQLCLSYTIFSDRPVLTRNARFTQLGQEKIRLSRALSMTLDLPDSNYDWIHLDGAWGRERHISINPLHKGIQSIYSLKGSSSSEHNPFIALKRPQTDEHHGEVIGFSLVYSGNFLAQIDVTPFEQTRISMGIHPDGFEWQLNMGEIFQTPEIVMVYSDNGLNGMSQVFHELYSKRLVRGVWRDKKRPILLNNWEAMSFDFNEDKIMALAEKAKSVGVELFVMDDGWFGARNHDYAGLGDWFVNKEKLPSGINGIAKKIHDFGMLFGLWIEPEMVNKDSNLFREHPDWILHHPKRSQSHSRHQFTLDLSREDVYQNIYQQIHRLLSENAIDYIKWDMNRYMTEAFSVYYSKNYQGEIFHRYILNVYRLYEALITDFPHILFESCSSGGGRFDPGMLYYAPQTWTSDNTDAIERLKIQYGTSLVYPLKSMGCHVSDVPNQQVRRLTSLDTRANVAYFGSFGYELDLMKATPDELEKIKKQIKFYQDYQHVFQEGHFTRLLSPFHHDLVAWQVVSKDLKTVIVGIYHLLVEANGVSKRIQLKGLDKESNYLLNEKTYSGSELMSIGIVIKEEELKETYQDFSSHLLILERK
ncbi:alpha-galactosidase [Streptococcus zalophi]|uniref:alpha-galactosidase n=1 Tax=Streptococcus zalophi TaxID=640031 RepID=UPI00215C82A0|nr:alpha-galactosidase [Streptococcus zalophi]MCR8967770.1 alpha-galactosidase [Streptococcus zalophi]